MHGIRQNKCCRYAFWETLKVLRPFLKLLYCFSLYCLSIAPVEIIFFYHENFIHVCIYLNNREMLHGLKRHSIIHNVGNFFSQKLTHEARFTNPTSHTQLLC